jgi:hypothetical protein
MIGDDDVGPAAGEFSVELAEPRHHQVRRGSRHPRRIGLHQDGAEADLATPADEHLGHRRGEDGDQQPVVGHAPRSGLSP